MAHVETALRLTWKSPRELAMAYKSVTVVNWMSEYKALHDVDQSSIPSRRSIVLT
jgi:hypothetical protein